MPVCLRRLGKAPVRRCRGASVSLMHRYEIKTSSGVQMRETIFINQTHHSCLIKRLHAFPLLSSQEP